MEGEAHDDGRMVLPTLKVTGDALVQNHVGQLSIRGWMGVGAKGAEGGEGCTIGVS